MKTMNYEVCMLKSKSIAYRNSTEFFMFNFKLGGKIGFVNHNVYFHTYKNELNYVC